MVLSRKERRRLAKQKRMEEAWAAYTIWNRERHTDLRGGVLVPVRWVTTARTYIIREINMDVFGAAEPAKEKGK